MPKPTFDPITRRWKTIITGQEWPFRICGDGVEQHYLARCPKAEGRWGVCVGTPDNNGYHMTTWKLPNGKRRYMRVHIVVWITHNGPIPKDMEIDHIDMDKSNNLITNLRLVTHAQNLKYAREKLGNWAKGKLLPHQIELVLAASLDSTFALRELAERWGVNWKTLYNLRAKAKKQNDPRYLSGL